MIYKAACTVPYHELIEIADRLLDECGEDEGMLAEKLDGLVPELRNELLVSDLLNAYQTFFYFFREIPDILRMERLILMPASALEGGVIVDEVELLELIFGVIAYKPVMVVSDGEKALATFLGTDAYRDALTYIESTL
ncbi:MAG: hypothetical protein OS112_06035 [Methanoregula sp.]|nr:MAG: hypothetical protein OS112_06035 [Methanoregula sp.]